MNRLGIAHVHSREFTEMVVMYYLGMEHQKVSSSDPLASPIFGSVSDMPPTMIHSSESDISLDDARNLEEKLLAESVAASMHTWPRINHMWERYELEYCQNSIQISADFLLAQFTGTQ
jgi:acetyl esterase/lipase